jgi:hypothetical protein
MDKSLLMFRGGVRSVVHKLGGAEHKLHFKAKTPNEIATFLGAERRYPQDEAGDLAREKNRAAFIAASLCDESGELLMTADEAVQIPLTTKAELCALIYQGSNQAGDAGNV